MSSTSGCLNEEREHFPYALELALYSTRGNLEKRRLAAQLIERDNKLHSPFYDDFTTEEKRTFTLEQIKRFVQVTNSIKDEKLRHELKYLMSMSSSCFAMRYSVHSILFVNALKFFGTKEQFEMFQHKIDHLEIYGCFAMTELGHSSYLRDIETVAVYHKEKEGFLLHSPTLTSTKVWIGAAGQTATHAVVLARLIIRNKDEGLHWLLVQLRDTTTMQCKPGITCGDMGNKAGRNGLDNGWIQFTHVFIPQQQLLCRWSHLNSEGMLVHRGNPSLAYATLIPERIILGTGSIMDLQQALTIATRYTACRQQGPDQHKVLDYQTVYSNILPAIAFVYVMEGLDRVLNAQWEATFENIQTNPEEFLRRIPDLHATSAAYKAMVSWGAANYLELCRRVCGGHAYSAYTGISRLIQDHGVNTTGGGDNYPLTQQTVRHLLKCKQRADNGKVVLGWADYLNQRSIPKPESKMTTTETIINGLVALCTRKISNLEASITQQLQVQNCPRIVWNQHLSEMVVISRLHFHQLSLRAFSSMVNETVNESVYKIHPEWFEVPTCIRPLMNELLSLHALQCVMDEAATFMEEDIIQPSEIQEIRSLLNLQCQKLRKMAVPLVDGWAIPDFVHRSPLGNFSGNIYEGILFFVDLQTTGFKIL